MSLRQKIDSFNMTRNLTNQRKEAEKASDVNVQFTSLDVKLVLKRKLLLYFLFMKRYGFKGHCPS